MILDILTVLWKETKELFHQQGRMRGGWLGMVLFVGVFGIFMPLQSGPQWISSPIPLIYWSWVPFMLVSSVIADSFAGERERHTLETLLASRLSDRAILFGKISAAIAYGWGLTMACALLSVASINLVYWNGQVIFYPLRSGLAIFTFSLLIAGLATGLGVLISLRASTVRQAQQTFSIAFFLLFIPFFALPLLPEGLRTQAVQFIMQVDLELIVITAGAALFLLDAGLIAAAIRRFQRNRLILD